MWRIGIGQMTSTASPVINERICRHLIEQARRRGCQALFLPESSDFIADPSAIAESSGNSWEAVETFHRDCMEAAHKAGIWLFIGVHKQAAPSSNSHSLNAYLAIDGANRRIAAEYHKIHLFDQYPTRQQSSNNNSKQPLLLESSTTARGCKPPPTAIVSDQIRVGMAVCYDIRFPELSKYLVEQGQATVLTYPSAFTVPTGRDHWEILCRARAIETQCYLVASAQYGQHNVCRRSWGGSMVVDPWGKVVLQCPTVDDGVSVIGDVEAIDEGCWLGVCQLDMATVQTVRERMPLSLHRQQREYNDFS